MRITFQSGWQILQDVHDAGEQLGLHRPGFMPTVGNQISEWEALPELKQLQLVYADQPYFGRELRYFNQAPWWYRREFDLGDAEWDSAVLTFSNVDYYCKIWLNGRYIGEHEGYSMPFSFRVEDALTAGRNTLIAKVWSPWDDAVDGGHEDARTFSVVRNAVKGTYEHADTFVQRDVNPVGIYGEVALKLSRGASFDGAPDVSYELDASLSSAELTARASVTGTEGGGHQIKLTLTDRLTRRIVGSATSGPGELVLRLRVDGIRLWNTWDRGGARLYDARVELLDADGHVLDCHREPVGFRKIELVRTPERTQFDLNGHSLYVRGTSYFPDVYASNMCYERYMRDMLAVKAAGFNLIRIHVHVELDMLYEICSEIGIGIMQDSEYNWMHPVTDAFADRFIGVFLDTVRMLKRHSSVLCWICMNEPGGGAEGRPMTANPGPKLYASVRALDPSRPAIKGSFCEDDPESGDSHNYTGSLNGDETRYEDIFGTVEKLNTEYGFDAPPCLHSLQKCAKIHQRLRGIEDRLDEIGRYQYALLKYYTEHYRTQKYAPNAGYVQFLFSDLCPQSFYGLYDWWGLPKPGLLAMLESNMPTGIFLRYNRQRAVSIWAVHDGEALGDAAASYVFTDGDGHVLASGEARIELGADSIVQVWTLDIDLSGPEAVHCALLLEARGAIVASNHYSDLSQFPAHIPGHPSRMSHELGMRLYFA